MKFLISLHIKAVARLNHMHTIPKYLLNVRKWVSPPLERWKKTRPRFLGEDAIAKVEEWNYRSVQPHRKVHEIEY